jgi:hypothetical protein
MKSDIFKLQISWIGAAGCLRTNPPSIQEAGRGSPVARRMRLHGRCGCDVPRAQLASA